MNENLICNTIEKDIASTLDGLSAPTSSNLSSSTKTIDEKDNNQSTSPSAPDLNSLTISKSSVNPSFSTTTKPSTSSSNSSKSISSSNNFGPSMEEPSFHGAPKDNNVSSTLREKISDDFMDEGVSIVSSSTTKKPSSTKQVSKKKSFYTIPIY